MKLHTKYITIKHITKSISFTIGINTAADVANLVAKAFSTTTNRKKPDLMSLFQPSQQQDTSAEEDNQQSEQNEPPPSKVDIGFDTANLLTGVLRMIGFDASKLGAIAINTLILVAQAIGSTILSATRPPQRLATVKQHGEDLNSQTGMGPDAIYEQNEHQPRKLRDGSPVDWFLENPNEKMKQLLTEITDKNLSDKVITMIEEKETEPGQAGCIKMLMCKTSPIIWGMQKSVNERLNKNSTNEVNTKDRDAQQDFNAKALFKDLPSLSEFRAHSDICEKRYGSYCNTSDYDSVKKN
ncbi:uncharacterized protein LOC119663417 [Teleopsis dalmanni]|uniref:uncharacterized protein LOC119663417 n=1 Tax=Teleopsis dalmanni TaxID=139649 RepID=UPI0018CDB66F|nr:uncharacterized protein LOC119663417 [Teleopsis dalmanni]